MPGVGGSGPGGMPNGGLIPPRPPLGLKLRPKPGGGQSIGCGGLAGGASCEGFDPSRLCLSSVFTSGFLSSATPGPWLDP